MKITSSKPKKQRILKCLKHSHLSCGKKVYNKRPFWVEPIGKNWWFNLEKGEWAVGYDSDYQMTSSYYSMKPHGYNDVYSLKAVKRLVSKWNVPKGTKFKASLPFVGYTFILTK